jgi:hypothetical protein
MVNNPSAFFLFLWKNSIVAGFSFAQTLHIFIPSAGSRIHGLNVPPLHSRQSCFHLPCSLRSKYTFVNGITRPHFAHCFMPSGTSAFGAFSRGIPKCDPMHSLHAYSNPSFFDLSPRKNSFVAGNMRLHLLHTLVIT